MKTKKIPEISGVCPIKKTSNFQMTFDTGACLHNVSATKLQ